MGIVSDIVEVVSEGDPIVSLTIKIVGGGALGVASMLGKGRASSKSLESEVNGALQRFDFAGAEKIIRDETALSSYQRDAALAQIAEIRDSVQSFFRKVGQLDAAVTACLEKNDVSQAERLIHSADFLTKEQKDKIQDLIREKHRMIDLEAKVNQKLQGGDYGEAKKLVRGANLASEQSKAITSEIDALQSSNQEYAERKKLLTTINEKLAAGEVRQAKSVARRADVLSRRERRELRKQIARFDKDRRAQQKGLRQLQQLLEQGRVTQALKYISSIPGLSDKQRNDLRAHIQSRL